MNRKDLVLCLGILFSLAKSSHNCDKIPSDVVAQKNINDAGRYIIEIPGNPQTYTPLQRYNISLKINPRMFPQKTFKQFMVTIEATNGETENRALGQLGYEDDGTSVLVRMSTLCPNTVVESNPVSKSEIKVYWIAPPKGSGCVAIKATVVQSKENWFSEDGPLTKILCEETLPDENIQPDILERCCACDEAKYEMAFEGKWTRNTHPNHFPVDQWNTKFSDVIGASHQLFHAFWKYEDIASDGTKELGETGNTKTLESELKNNSEHIRTIIKARGLQYPNITKSTYAVFRVDNKNHLVSLATKIMPSPDWIVGVSNLELCRQDCTWEETRALNLYPWDVGTDDGLGYESSIPTYRRQSIRRITPNNPNDPNSPFYNEKGEEMKPLAKLHLTRQRLYSKTCKIEEGGESDCATSEWSEWSLCSSACGKGTTMRERTPLYPDKYLQCQESLREIKLCFGRDCPSGEEAEEPTKENFVAAQDIPICGDGDKNCEDDPNCPGTYWGPWSNCSVDCGKGKKTRLRLNKSERDDDEDQTYCAPSEEADCEVPCSDEESSGNRYGGLGSKNILNIVHQGPVGEVTDCKVSKWSSWSDCILESSAECGNGYKYKVRDILRHQANGGKECPKKLKKRINCTIPCPSLDIPQVCSMSKWSNWTPCSSTCGSSAVQIRTRQILYKPPGLNRCPTREEKRLCRLPLACFGGERQPIFKR